MTGQLITGASARQFIESEIGDQGIAAVSEDVEDLFEDLYEDEDPMSDPTYMLGLKVLVHRLPYDLELDPTIVGVEAEQATSRGVQEASFGHWHIEVNWDKKAWAGKIPPGYMRVVWNDVEMAILGPWLTIRTCWFCKRGGFANKKAQIGIVIPDHPCPFCGYKDWFGLLATPADFERDCREDIADQCGHDERIWQMTAGGIATPQ